MTIPMSVPPIGIGMPDAAALAPGLPRPDPFEETA